MDPSKRNPSGPKNPRNPSGSPITPIDTSVQQNPVRQDTGEGTSQGTRYSERQRGNAAARARARGRGSAPQSTAVSRTPSQQSIPGTFHTPEELDISAHIPPQETIE